MGENRIDRKSFQSKDRGYREREPGREPQKMYKAKCSECDMETELPFKPDPISLYIVESVMQNGKAGNSKFTIQRRAKSKN